MPSTSPTGDRHRTKLVRMTGSLAPQDIPFRLAAIDIDDTLLGADARISDANAHAVARLQARGVQIVLASGRSHANMLPFHRELGLPRGPILSAQGAVVRDSFDGAVWSSRFHSPAMVTTLTQRGRALGFAVQHYALDEVLVDSSSPWIDYDQSRNVQAHRVVPDLLAGAIDDIVKVMWLGDPDAIGAALAEARREYGTSATVIPTDPPYLEFAAPDTNKSMGLIAITERLRIRADQVLAFGDGTNDVEMLSWAGLGIAMSHAREVAKRAARMVAPAGEHNSSLARAIALALL